MPKAREWPTSAADDRDRAAENVNEAAVHLERISGQVAPAIAIEITKAEINLQKTLRLLERHGAKTRVPELQL